MPEETRPPHGKYGFGTHAWGRQPLLTGIGDIIIFFQKGGPAQTSAFGQH
jgi:hypothetical protein